MEELQRFVLELVESINTRYRSAGYEPVVWLERPVPLYEKIALYSIAGGAAAHSCLCLSAALSYRQRAGMTEAGWTGLPAL